MVFHILYLGGMVTQLLCYGRTGKYMARRGQGQSPRLPLPCFALVCLGLCWHFQQLVVAPETLPLPSLVVDDLHVALPSSTSGPSPACTLSRCMDPRVEAGPCRVRLADLRRKWNGQKRRRVHFQSAEVLLQKSGLQMFQACGADTPVYNLCRESKGK